MKIRFLVYSIAASVLWAADSAAPAPDEVATTYRQLTRASSFF